MPVEVHGHHTGAAVAQRLEALPPGREGLRDVALNVRLGRIDSLNDQRNLIQKGILRG